MARSADKIAIRKRAQIARANRMMFLWVAGASVIVGFSVVVAIFLGQSMLFRGKVISEKETTLRTLDNNLAAVNPDNDNSLANNIRKYESDSRLLSVATNTSQGHALQSVLDALPSQPNSLALGASLQYRLLNGITIESLHVDDAGAVGGGTAAPAADSTSSSTEFSSAQPIGFGFTVTGSAAALQEVLQRLESSIRTINVTSLTLEVRSPDMQALIVQGQAYYQPERVVELKDKTIKP